MKCIPVLVTGYPQAMSLPPFGNPLEEQQWWQFKYFSPTHRFTKLTFTTNNNFRGKI
jgi:hypothetical protein